MTFINEFISDHDMDKYGIKELDRRFLKLTHRPQWTKDKENDVFIREMAIGREEFSNQSDFAMYWKGSLILIRLEVTGGGERGGLGWSNYKLIKMELAEELETFRPDILNNLKEALSAFKDGGVYSTRAISKTT